MRQTPQIHIGLVVKTAWANPFPAGVVYLYSARTNPDLWKGVRMKGTILSLVTGTAICATVFPIIASANARPINQRQQNQQVRIQRGIRSGELTRPEARRLGVEQARIRAIERRARSDAEFTARERIRLQRELNQANRRIHYQTHDKQTRE
jgi:hypothetical protein